MPCLATRIPYGESLERGRLSRIDEAESFIRKLGFRVVRVRDRGNAADVEIGEDELAKLDLDAFRRDVFPFLDDLGYRSIDISPYKSGRWDGANLPTRG